MVLIISMLVVFMVLFMSMMLVMCCVCLSGPLLQEKDDIYELENTESVKDDKGDEPPNLPQLGRMPESVAL